ncbi:hypothetical protein Tco_1411522 [Tanacetum coccineum]
MDACLVTEDATLEACFVTERITMDDNLVVKESTVDSTSSEQLDECNNSMEKIDTVSSCFDSKEQHMQLQPIQALEASLVVMKSSGTESENNSSESTFSRSKNENRSSDKESSSSKGNDADADISPSYNSDNVTENNSNIIFYIPNMDPDRDKEEHDYVAYEQQCAFFASLINNLKYDVEKSNEVNCEAQQIKLLYDEISNLNSQVCEKDKTFAKENEKYDEYVQPLLKKKNELEKKNQEFLKQINDLDNRLRKAGQTDQILRMLLPKEDNVQTGKQGLGFENQNDNVTQVF